MIEELYCRMKHFAASDFSPGIKDGLKVEIK